MKIERASLSAPYSRKVGRLDLTKDPRYRIMYRMKVTAIIPDQLVEEVRKASGGKNITDSLIVALREWTEMKRIKELNARVAKRPLSFHEGYSAGSVRELNRKR